MKKGEKDFFDLDNSIAPDQRIKIYIDLFE